MNRNIRITILLFALAAALCLSACGGRNAAEFHTEDGIDLDLTRLSGTMVYAEVFNMRYEPEDYYGKVIRMEGYFSAYRNPNTGEYYYNCVVPDATACCSQGIQFFPGEALVYPDDFPENGADVIIVGTFEKNEENLYMCSLADCTMELASP